VLCHDFKGFYVHCGFREPHALRPALKAVFEIENTPNDLSFFVATVGKWHDHVVVRLGDGRSMA
jgi:hypothetical protein